jgi:hypothetical protein
MQSGSTVLTGKGMRNNTRHRAEVDAGSKRSRYEAMKQRLWNGYLQRRESNLRQKQQQEALAPQQNVLQGVHQPQQPQGVQPVATPSTNVIKAKGAIQAKTTTRKNYEPE